MTIKERGEKMAKGLPTQGAKALMNSWSDANEKMLKQKPKKPQKPAPKKK